MNNDDRDTDGMMRLAAMVIVVDVLIALLVAHWRGWL